MKGPVPPRPNVRGWTLFAIAGEDDATPTGDAPASVRASEGARVVGGRFELGELLGSGGTSCVWACKDLNAAIKVLMSADEDARRRFVDEGRILTCLRHPHLVQVLAVGETDAGAPFMVLERLPGQDLDERLQREGPLPWLEVAEMIAQVAAALEALHDVGVIHRDVKPSNIVVVGSATSRPFVKLIDLGIAKVDAWQRVQSTGEPPARHQTDVGKVLGTDGFYPPEAALERPNPRFDVFGLGATIYLLCTGQLPDLVDYRPMREARPGCGVPPELERLVTDSLAPVPEDRIATVAEFQSRLERVRLEHVEDDSPFLFEGCYELIELLGAGAKAEVHRAYHRDATRYVALKILSERACQNAEERVRFAREARALRAVRHPALPELFDCRTALTRKRPYIAMSLMRGKSARSFYLGGRLKPEQVIAVGRQLAGALAALHAQGILHRDVHGQNVLVDLEGEPTAALIDCGMVEFEAKFYAMVEQRYPTPPEARVKLGTGGLERLDWTAPEARAGKGWTAKSDVYSLGLLLYQLVTGRRPTRDERGEWVSPRQHVQSCPPALASALLNTLADEPTARVDMRGLLAKLEAAADEMAEETCDEEENAGSGPTVARAATGSVAARPAVGVPAALVTNWPLMMVFAALGAVLVGLAVWQVIFESPTPAPQPIARTEEVLPPARPPPEVAAPAPAPVLPPAPLPTMREAVDRAAVDLRRCSELAGGLLLVEFETTAGRSEFARVEVPGSNDESRRCVVEALRSIRFEPTDPQTFIEEYTP
nr:serine/threonine-protein kinase [Nannocystis sp. RBIL2]